MQLSLPDVSAMLPLGIVRVGFNLMRRKHPVSNHITPNSNPNDHIATRWLDLLEVHPERLGRIRRQGFDIQRRFDAGVNCTGRLYFNPDLPVKQEVVMT